MSDSEENSSETQNVLFSFASCFQTRESGFLYVSTPITTGKKYLEWLRLCAAKANGLSNDRLPSRDIYVNRRNMSEASELVIRVREHFPHTLINPTGLQDIVGWKQADYHSFWVTIIKNFVSMIIMAEGWEYSNGSTIEYLQAREKGIPILDHHFCVISPEDAELKMENSKKEFSEVDQFVHEAKESLHHLDTRSSD